ncbi:DUF3014 domain-containing protein [Pseudocolwellia agarivorans]|uniref:DUF3014 domain-containing protein n=1 Tax=Pseudocolwellia agarivorans TaxID=1911682 RepID=UPI000985C52C|nr:DUF3014 domain-containing protein [Pseudocolwellia agarivorans]
MSSSDSKPSSWALVTIIIIMVIGLFLSWKFFLSEPDNEKVVETINEPTIIEAPLVEDINSREQVEENINNPIIEESIIEPPSTIEVKEPKAVIKVEIPALNESDSWVKDKLTSIIWRKELLELLIDEDMVRRFVVFVDNFSQGNIAYSHSPFIKPTTSFAGKKVISEDEAQVLWKFDESTFKRFSLYVDLFRSVNSETLVEWYKELHPLIKQAYSELGYPDQDFDQVLQVAITKVLDLEFPKENKELVRPSVMYRYKSEEMEALDDADKLMLRIGKDNLLIIKSVLLEINEKLNKRE